MSSHRTLLIVVDPTQGVAQPSVRCGSWLAQKLGYQVELLIVHSDRQYTDYRVVTPHGWSRARHKIVNLHADHLEVIAARLGSMGLKVSLSVTCDWPYCDGIVRHALYTKPKLVVKEAHYHSKLRRSLFSSTDWELIRNCPSPLWLAKPHEWAEGAPVIAAVDPNIDEGLYQSLDTQILDSANFIGEKIGSETYVFNAFLPASKKSKSDAITPADEYEQLYTAKHRQYLDDFIEGYKVNSENIYCVPGFPEIQLPQLAEKVGARLVVMGAIARNKLGRLFIGSTTERVLDELMADVLVLKPHWFKCSVDALSHGNDGQDPQGHVFQVAAGTRPHWDAGDLSKEQAEA